MTEFSEELIQECIKVFKEESHIEFTKEQAIVVLHNMANLFVAFYSKN